MIPNTPVYYLLYCLYHHDVSYRNKTKGYNTDDLYKISQQYPNRDIEDIINVLQHIILSSVEGISDTKITVTLTGGLDSRLILSFLLNAGIKPNCLCFGNPASIDVKIARKIAERYNLKFHNPEWGDISGEWYYKWIKKTIELDSGKSHLHRAHRTAAIEQHAKLFNPDVLFTGHMGGEGIRGLVYNNYFASPYFERINETEKDKLQIAKQILKMYFVKRPADIISNFGLDFDFITWEKNGKKTNKLYFLYDLVGKIHHTQDLRIFSHYINNVVSPYLMEDYLKTLFASPYNMMNRGEGLYSRLTNRKLYCRILQNVFPDLMKVPLANGYMPSDYLKGLMYYLPKKLFQPHASGGKSSPNFSYGNWYVKFIKEHSSMIDNDIWEFFNRNEYMHQLSNGSHETNEGYWHRFSNPLYFSLVKRYLKAGEL